MAAKVQLAFRKMHGLGNDFMVIDARGKALRLTADQVAGLADRHTGVGFDQLLVLEHAGDAAADAAYRVFNANGGEAEQCGNGVRCLVRLVSDASGQPAVRLTGAAGLVSGERLANDAVRVNMGRPSFAPESIPFEAPAEAARYRLEAGSTDVEIGALSMGNPHAVLEWPALANAPLDTLGAAISRHARFPYQTNVEFMQVEDAGHIRLRVYERGVGETRACGSGACAAMAMGRRWGLLDDSVMVSLPGGDLRIDWPGPDADLFMTGPAVDVYGGTIEL